MIQKYNTTIKTGKTGDYVYIGDYIPRNKTGEYIKYNRGFYDYSELILKYKKGDPKTVAFFIEILNDIIYNYFYFYDLIIPVPPSNSYLDIYPNAVVCSYLSKLGIIDTALKAIVCSKGHKPGHIAGIETKKKELSYISVADKNDFLSKNIIILDDIITTGATFSYIKKNFLKKGANSVAGLFLGKTYSGCGSHE